jgi:protoporphyrinogen oxidase
MPDVVVIGGGLSGLAAAYELEKSNIPYTLIEVKARLGGSVFSEERDGFIIDGGAFALHKSHDWPWLTELGLDDSLAEGREDTVIFKRGTQVLVDALAGKLKSGMVMPRMSVSTLGEVDGNFAVCLENGMIIQAAALIVAAPARYAERMFYTFEPEISQRLLEFHYDTITRVSLGYRKEDFPMPVVPPPDSGFAFCNWTESEYRVPPGHILIQTGLRFRPGDTPPEMIIAELQKDMDWPRSHVVAHVTHWPESHSLTAHDPHHMETMAAILTLLPEGVALVGSDYGGLRVENRIEQGLVAAQQIAQWLHA